MARHFLDLQGAAIVATEHLLETRGVIRAAVEARAIAAIHGAAGTGKTFAVEQALTDTPEKEWARIEFRCRPSLRDVRHGLYAALGIGRLLPSSVYEADLALKAALRERPRLLVLDEAQWLNRECFEYLRHLHDDPDTQFAMLFVGGAGCYEVLRREPMLDSRLYCHLRFEPLTFQQVLAVTAVYHPVYDGVGDDLIALIDRRCAHGNFRTWAKVTHHAVRLCSQTGRECVDEEIVRNVFRLVGGGTTRG